MTERALAAIGSKIKQLRESKCISVEQMLERTGLDPEFYQSLEDNDVVPALGDLIKVARVLGTRVGMLLDDLEDDGPAVCRAEESEATLAMRSRRVEKETYSYYSLSGKKGNRHMETYIVNLMPAKEEKPLKGHEGEEFLYVLEGEAEVLYGKESYLLKKGDSIYFDSIVPHHVGSASKEEPAKLMASLYIPR